MQSILMSTASVARDVLASLQMEICMFCLAVGTYILFSGHLTAVRIPQKGGKVAPISSKPSPAVPAPRAAHAEAKGGRRQGSTTLALQRFHVAIRAGRGLEALEQLLQLPAPSTSGPAARLLGVLARSSVLGEGVVEKLMESVGKFDAKCLEAAAAELQQQGDLHACKQLYHIASLASIPKTPRALELLALGHAADPVAQQAFVEELLASNPNLPESFPAIIATASAVDAKVADALERARGFAKAISAYGKDGNLDMAKELFSRLQSHGPVNIVVQNCFLDACVQCEDMAAAMEQFDRMKASSEADCISYNIVMKGAAREDMRVAHGLLAEMAQRGIAGNRVTFHGALNNAAVQGDLGELWVVLAKMQDAGYAPNAVTCSIMLKGVMSPSQVPAFKRILGMIELLKEPMEEGLFASIIEACLRTESHAQLTAQSRAFAKRGGLDRLTSPTFGVLIRAHGQSGELSRVWELWQQMITRQVMPSAITFGCMVEALVMNRCTEDAWELTGEARTRFHLKPCDQTVLYSTIIKGFSWAKQHHKVKTVYAEMLEHNVPRNTITYNTILNSMTRCGLMHEMPALLEEMRASVPPVKPDIVTYSTIIKGYCQGGDVDLAFKVLEEMKSDAGVVPDEVTYNSLLDGCARHQRLDDALRLLDEMRAARVVPSNYTLSIACKLLGRARRLPQAFDLIESVTKEHGFRPNIAVYTCLIQACFQNRQLGKALALHEQVLSDSLVPDEKTYTVLAQGCLQAGAVDKAVAVVRCAFKLPGQELLRPAPGRPQGVEETCLAKVLVELGRTGAAAAQELEAQVRACTSQRGCGPPGGSRPRLGAAQRGGAGRR